MTEPSTSKPNPSTVRVVSPNATLARLVASHLERSGFAASVVVREDARQVLRVRKGTSADTRNVLQRELQPFTPSIESLDELDVDVELVLGGTGLESINLRVFVESNEPTDALVETLEGLGVGSPRVQPGVVLEPVLIYGGASRFARQALRWYFGTQGVRLTEKREWHPTDLDVLVRAVDGTRLAMPPRERFRIEIRTDDLAAGERLGVLLRSRGFDFEIAPIDSKRSGSKVQRFGLRAGAFADKAGSTEPSEIRDLLTEFLSSEGVDDVRWPVLELAERPSLRVMREEARQPTILLPIGAQRRGTLRAYGGSPAARYEVVVRSDEPARASALVAVLESRGFVGVRIEPLPPERLAVRIASGTLRDEAAILEQLRLDVSEFASGFSTKPVEVRRLPSEDERVVIDLPVAGHADGELARRALVGRSKWQVHIYHADGDPTALVRALRDGGYGSVRAQSSSGAGTALHFGGAPDAVLEHITSICREHATFEPELECCWHEGDRDIYIHLAEGALHGASDAPLGGRTEVAPDLRGWVHGVATSSDRPFLERTETRVRVGRCELSVRAGQPHPLAPRLEDFAHYCLDAITAETVLHVADAIAMGEPCLLEGETSTAKTSAVLFLAAQLGQPVVRLNLNGQSDTGELIGRYVPADSGGFRWQDGLVLRAMREGLWLLLDEVNLAEPQVLERLNSLLEREPSLVVSEHDGERIAGSAIHRDFRVIATMNPAEYSGRSALSPAWRDRWRAHRVVPAPNELAIEQFLRASVFGETPAVELAGARWSASTIEAPWGRLAVVGSMAPFLAALARFHVSLERALGVGGGPGSARRERYVVTRRNLLSVLDWLARRLPAGSEADEQAAMREALVRYYLERVAPGDRAAVVRLLDAAGIGPAVWSLRPSAASEAQPESSDDASDGTSVQRARRRAAVASERRLRALLDADAASDLLDLLEDDDDDADVDSDDDDDDDGVEAHSDDEVAHDDARARSPESDAPAAAPTSTAPPASSDDATSSRDTEAA